VGRELGRHVSVLGSLSVSAQVVIALSTWRRMNQIEDGRLPSLHVAAPLSLTPDVRRILGRFHTHASPISVIS